VLTFDQRNTAEAAGAEVVVRPTWEWLTAGEFKNPASGMKES